jgi:hypothetical protein
MTTASREFAAATLAWYASDKGRKKKDAARAVLQSMDPEVQWNAWGAIWGQKTRDDFAVQPSPETVALARKGRRKALAEVVVRWCEWEWQYR